MKVFVTGVAGQLGHDVVNELCRRGIDAIEYHYSAVHSEKALGDEMDRMLPGWDCDSILILNPQIIQPFFE